MASLARSVEFTPWEAARRAEARPAAERRAARPAAARPPRAARRAAARQGLAALRGAARPGGETLCAPSLCASLVTCLSLHFVVGVGRVAVGEWYHGGFTLCAALLLCSP